MTKSVLGVNCNGRKVDGRQCLASVTGGDAGVALLMKDGWTTVGSRHYCPAHKTDADERTEFERCADEAEVMMARARKMVSP